MSKPLIHIVSLICCCCPTLRSICSFPLVPGWRMVRPGLNVGKGVGNLSKRGKGFSPEYPAARSEMFPNTPNSGCVTVAPGGRLGLAVCWYQAAGRGHPGPCPQGIGVRGRRPATAAENQGQAFAPRFWGGPGGPGSRRSTVREAERLVGCLKGSRGENVCSAACVLSESIINGAERVKTARPAGRSRP